MSENGKTSYGRIVWEWLTWRPFALLAALSVGHLFLLPVRQLSPFSPWTRTGWLTKISEIAGPVVVAYGAKRRMSKPLAPAERRAQALVAGMMLAVVFLLTAFMSESEAMMETYRFGLRLDPVYVKSSYPSAASFFLQYGAVVFAGVLWDFAIAAWLTLRVSAAISIGFEVLTFASPLLLRKLEGAEFLLFYAFGVPRWLPLPVMQMESRWIMASVFGVFAALTIIAIGGRLLRPAANDRKRSSLALALDAWMQWRPMQLVAVLLCVVAWMWLTDFSMYSFRGDWRQLMWLTSTLSLLLALIPTALAAAVPVILTWRVLVHLRDWRSALIPGHRRAHLTVFAALAAGIFAMTVCLPVMQRWATQRSEAETILARFPVTTMQNPGIYEPYLSAAWTPPGDFFWLDRFRGSPYFTGLGTFIYSLPSAIGDMALPLLFFLVLAWVTVFGWAALAAIFTLLAAGGPIVFYSGNSALRGLENDILYWQPLVPLWVGLDLLLLVGLGLRLLFVTGGGSERAADDSAAWLSQYLVGLRRRPAGSLATAGLWERARHRRTVGLGHRFCVILAVYLAVLVGVTPLIAGDASWLQHLGYSYASLVIAAITSSLAVGLAWPQRVASLGDVEQLRPAGRRRFIREIGLAMLCDMGEISVLTLAAILIPIAYWSPDAMHSAAFWNAALAALLSQAMAFGVIACMIWLRIGAGSTLVLAAIIAATVVLIHEALDDRQVLPAAVAAALGVGLAVKAYRGWGKRKVAG